MKKELNELEEVFKQSISDSLWVLSDTMTFEQANIDWFVALENIWESAQKFVDVMGKIRTETREDR